MVWMEQRERLREDEGCGPRNHVAPSSVGTPEWLHTHGLSAGSFVPQARVLPARPLGACNSFGQHLAGGGRAVPLGEGCYQGRHLAGAE